MKDYIKCFINEEDAVETMEWIAIITVTAALIVVVAKCGKKLTSRLKSIASSI